MSFDKHDDIKSDAPSALDPELVSEDTYLDRFSVVKRGGSSNLNSKTISAWDDSLDSSATNRPKSSNRVSVSYSPEVTASELKDARLQDMDSPAKIEHNHNLDESNNNNGFDNSSDLERFRSAGLDSLFSSTSVTPANKATNSQKSADIENSEKKDEISVKRSRYADIKPKRQKGNATKSSSDSSEVKDSLSVTEAIQKKSASISQRIFKKDTRRKVIIVCPTSYNGVKEISDALKTDNVLALSLYKMKQNDRGRVLDFAFGAASMVDASVSIEGKQLFIFTKGQPLTPNERIYCHEQGLVINME